MKFCAKCKQLKDDSAFSKDKSSKDGLCCKCKDCYKDYYNEHRSAILEYGRQYKKTDKYADYRKQYTEKHPGVERMRSSRYYHKNRDAVLEKKRVDNINRPEHYRNQRRKSYLKDTRAAYERAKRRRLRKLSAPGSHTRSQWIKLCQFYDHRCLCCGRQEPEIKLTADHVVPLARGGSDNIANIQPLCSVCNSRKHARTVDYRKEIPAWFGGGTDQDLPVQCRLPLL